MYHVNRSPPSSPERGQNIGFKFMTFCSYCKSCTNPENFVKLLSRTKMLKNKDCPAFKLSDFVFIMLINVKMPTIVGILNIYEHDKGCAQLS